jgi:hypothetical protein
MIVILLFSIYVAVQQLAIAFSDSSNTENYAFPSVGVNMLGYHTTKKEYGSNPHSIPINYYEDSFRTFSDAGVNTVRFLFYWESYARNPLSFMQEIIGIARAADKWNIKIVYANDQFHISSWLDNLRGYGFPSFLFQDNPDFPRNSGNENQSSYDTTTAKWWTDWYNRTITAPINPYGLSQLNIDPADNSSAATTDGWTLQAEFLNTIVKAVNNNNSTLGYEILNEPRIIYVDQWDKVGNYNTFIASELRKFTLKPIFFDRQLPSELNGEVKVIPENIAKMAPKNVSNIVLKTSLYGLPTDCSYAEARLNIPAKAAQLLDIPLWMGEFNIGPTEMERFVDLNQTEIMLFLEKFREANVWGWSVWLWSFKNHSETAKNFGLANRTEDNRIQPSTYFGLLKNELISDSENKSNFDPESSRERDHSFLLEPELFHIKMEQLKTGNSSDNNNSAIKMHDTICPTTIIDDIEGVAESGINYFQTSQQEPVTLRMTRDKSNNSPIAVQGGTFDSSGDITKVEIHIDDEPYHDVIAPVSKGEKDWSRWTASVPVTNTTGVHRLIIKATDGAQNVEYTTVYLDFVIAEVTQLLPFPFISRIIS